MFIQGVALWFVFFAVVLASSNIISTIIVIHVDLAHSIIVPSSGRKAIRYVDSKKRTTNGTYLHLLNNQHVCVHICWRMYQSESKCQVDVEEYIKKFKVGLADITLCWCRGTKFVDLMVVPNFARSNLSCLPNDCC